jgi:hypothetical protein
MVHLVVASTKDTAIDGVEGTGPLVAKVDNVDRGYGELNVDRQRDDMLELKDDTHKTSHDMGGNRIVVVEGFNLSPVDFVVPQGHDGQKSDSTKVLNSKLQGAGC